MLYLDNSATTYPKPQIVRSAMANSFSGLGANPGRSGYAMSINTSKAVFDARQTAADFFSADGPECVIWEPSCTQAINTVIKGVLKKGDHVVVSDLEHNAVMRPIKKLSQVDISYSVATVYAGDNNKTIDSFRQAITPKTKLVVCTHASNVFGICLPIERIAALAHFYGAKICVDCAQTAGVVPINIGDSGIDYLCVAGHKGLYGTMGTGALIIRAGDSFDTLVEGGTGTNSRELFQPPDAPERYESGTQNIPGILALEAGIKFVKSKGVENIRRTEMGLISYLYDMLSRNNKVVLYTERPNLTYFVPVLSFNIKDIPSEETGEYLAKNNIAVRCGLHCAPTAHEKMGTLDGTVRVSPSVFTTKNDIDMFIARINSFTTGKIK